MRLFVAATPPAVAVEHLRLAIPARARLTAVEGWHLTLVFLGEVPDDEPVRAALDRVPLPAEPIELRLSGSGHFGAAVWAGVEGDLLELAELQEAVHKAVAVSDDRAFRPHLTVARDRQVLSALAHYEGPPWTVSGFTLFRSHHLTGGGYEPLANWG